MAYSSISKPSLHFNTKLYTGNSGSQSITGVGFQPDFTWIKTRTSNNHRLFDVLRGVNKNIKSNDTQGEITATDQLMSFDSDGFTLGADGSVNSNTVVSWNWKGGGSGGANSDGTISTSVSANTTSGFSIMTYTGTGSAGTIGHGLGAKPDAWFVKARSETRAWYGWHKSMPLGDVWNLNANGTKSTDTSLFTSNAPTTSVINLGSSVGTNNNGITFVCYAFAEKKGFSKFGSYTGNGSADGTFVYLGFKPAWIMIKPLATASWRMWDNKREDYNGNPNQTTINANETGAEYDDSSVAIDFLSNGFKGRSSNSDISGSGVSYNYFAFAEEPLVANVGASIPATAR